jgi:hypothetical protein
MTAREFLEVFAAQVGVPAPSQREFDAPLEVVSVAARTSERVAAPLPCWMGGARSLPAAEPLAAATYVAAGAEAS